MFILCADLPKLRGKVETFLDGHDLFVSERVAALPEAERDFVLARALAPRGEFAQIRRTQITMAVVFLGPVMLTGLIIMGLPDAVFGRGAWWLPLMNLWMWLTVPMLAFAERRRHGPAEDRTFTAYALRATANPAGARALVALSESDPQRKAAEKEANALQSWWITKGQKLTEASEWYQRERSLAAKAE